ncbi:MAG TPA: amino acid adenylation domain-containing protein [Hymenobacter sp.]|jgi:amino acid adenylation domain-containing protein|uniref:non-ribosomal peptide synthetase n=1 Tax=Hymenobacter sp. TaxID=1898978 RepID=UPI002ED9147E
MTVSALAPAVQAVDFNPFAGAELTHLVPLTASQAEIWLACQLGGDDASRAYNESVSLRLHGAAFDVAALRTALSALAERHEALRATCSADGTVLCIASELTPELTFQDLAAHDTAARAAALAAHAQGQAQHVFNMQAGPLWHVALLKLAENEFHLTFTAHHLVCDGWSLGLLLQDLGRLYSAAIWGVPAVLATATSFSEYADAETLFQRTAEYRTVEQYWLQTYRDGAPALNLPTDFPRPAARTYQSSRLDYPLDPTLVASLRRLGVQVGASFVTTLLAVFEVLLGKLTGQEDLVVGMPAAGQAATGLATVVGHCVNLLPLRSQPVGSAPFEDYLRSRKSTLFDALEHQQLTYGSLLSQLPLRREPGRLPLVAAVFNVDMGLDDDVVFDGFAHELHSNPRAFENFELSLNASGRGNQLVLECSYNVALFRPERIEQLLASFARLAEQLVANPATVLADLQLAVPALPEAYQRLNATRADYPAAATLPALIAAQARATPTSVAVEFGAVTMTYAELDHQANQLAHCLHAHQVQPGDLVAVAVERSVGLLVALLAVLKCGAAYVPLDPAYPAERIEFMLADSGARLLLTSAGGLPGLGTATPRLVLEEALAEAVGLPGTEPAPASTSAALCYVLYTSGSTGQPKGVAITHRNFVNFLVSMQREPGMAATDRMLAVTTISFDIAGMELFLPLISGATVVLADAYSVRDGRALRHLLETKNITMLQATPATWHLLLAAGWEQPLPLVALCGGEALPLELARQLLPRCRALWNMYGPTETTVWSAVQQVPPNPSVITVGRPIANIQYYVLNERREPVAPGTPGEIFIGGAGVAQGYWQREALTAERFTADPFSAEPGARLYRTGDAGQLLANGEVQVLGRLDNQIKLRGYRIEPGEIEAHLTQLPGVRQAVVALQAHGPHDQRLAAYLVLAEEPAAPETTAEQLAAQLAARRAGWQAALRAHLPAYMVPADFVVLAALPLTPNGKVNRRALGQGPAPVPPPAPVTAVGHVAPRTSVEQLIAGVWAKALGLAKVSVYANFFDLGGHSLIAVQVMAQLEKVSGKRLPLAALFTHPTVAALALLLQLDGKFITWDALVPIKPAGQKMPLYIVHGAGLNVMLFNALAHNLDPDQPVYGLQSKGLNGVDEPLARIEDMAAHYVAAIRVQNPDGPYALAGFSFGGIIAFEMARQLLALGNEVSMLAVFDTYADQSNHSAPWYRRVPGTAMLTLKEWLYKLMLVARAPGRATARRRRLLKQRLARLKHRSPALPEANASQQARIDRTNEQAWRQYVFSPLPIAVELFRARERTFYMPDPTFLGWKPLALHGVNVHDMPGEHSLMFAPPHDKAFAASLQAVLNQAAAG